jgi:hypothetical protein
MLEGDEVTDRTTGEVADQEGGNYLLVPYHLLSKSTFAYPKPCIDNASRGGFTYVLQKMEAGRTILHVYGGDLDS